MIFPYIIIHIFWGYRGEQTFDNLTGTSAEIYWSQIKSFFGFFSGDMAGGLLGYFLIICVVCALYKIFLDGARRKDLGRQSVSARLPMLTALIVPSVIYFFLLCKITVYVTDRYLFIIYAVAYIWVFELLLTLLERVFTDKRICTAAVLLVLSLALTGSYKTSSWSYLYRSDSLQDTMAEYADLDAVVIDDGSTWKCLECYQQIRHCASAVFVKKDELDLLSQTDAFYRNEVIIFAVSESSAKQMVEQMPYVNQYESLGGFSYFTAYRAYGVEETENASP